MAVLLPKFHWCIVQIGKEELWWVKEVSEDIHWDSIDGKSILDPNQITQVLDAASVLEPYGIRAEDWNDAFFRFKIDKRLNETCIRLVRTEECLPQPEEPLFALPKNIDELQTSYVDFVDALIKARVKYLNKTIDFVEKLSVDEMKNLLTENAHACYFSGESYHVFHELMEILEYVPSGFEADVKAREEENRIYEEEEGNIDFSDKQEFIEEEKLQEFS